MSGETDRTDMVLSAKAKVLSLDCTIVERKERPCVPQTSSSQGIPSSLSVTHFSLSDPAYPQHRSVDPSCYLIPLTIERNRDLRIPFTSDVVSILLYIVEKGPFLFVNMEGWIISVEGN